MLHPHWLQAEKADVCHELAAGLLRIVAAQGLHVDGSMNAQFLAYPRDAGPVGREAGDPYWKRGRRLW